MGVSLSPTDIWTEVITRYKTSAVANQPLTSVFWHVNGSHLRHFAVAIFNEVFVHVCVVYRGGTDASRMKSASQASLCHSDDQCFFELSFIRSLTDREEFVHVFQIVNTVPKIQLLKEGLFYNRGVRLLSASLSHRDCFNRLILKKYTYIHFLKSRIM